MNEKAYYEALCIKNPKLRGADEEHVTLTKRGIRNIVLQAFRMGEEAESAKAKGVDLFEHFFRGANK
jgi:hypothetical protein